MIYGQPVTMGNAFNIAYGLTPPTDTSKLWVPLGKSPSRVEITGDDFQRDTDRLVKRKLVLPTPLAHPAVTPIHQGAYIFGGYNGEYQDAVYKVQSYSDSYEPEEETVTQIATLPVAMCGAAAATVSYEDYNDYRALGTYIIGGYNGTYLNNIYKMQTDASTGQCYFVIIGTLPVGLAYASAVVYEDHIYIIGGKSTNGVQSAVYVFDPVTFTCSHYCDLAEATYGAAVAQPYNWRIGYGSKLYSSEAYIFGGYNYKTSIQRIELGKTSPPNGEVLDTKMPIGIQYASAVPYADPITNDMSIHICGGQAAKTQSESVILKFDVSTKTISETKSALPSMPYGMGAYPDMDTNEGLFLIGGCDGTDYLDSLWCYSVRHRLDKRVLRIYATSFEKNGKYDPAVVNILNSRLTQLKLHISSVYYSDYIYVNDPAVSREQVAYVYNTEVGEWQTLDGVSYSAT